MVIMHTTILDNYSDCFVKMSDAKSLNNQQNSVFPSDSIIVPNISGNCCKWHEQ